MDFYTLDVSVKYEFPVGFQPTLVRGLAAIIENALSNFDLAKKMIQIRTADLSVDVQRALADLTTEVDQFVFTNQALLNSKLPYVTKDKEEVITLRRELNETVYRIVSLFRDFKVTRRMQVFQLTKFANYVRDVNQRHMTADGQPAEQADSQAGTMALHNLEYLTQYYDSVESSTAMKALLEALEVVNDIAPSVSFGPMKFDEEDTLKRLPVVQF